MSNTKKEQNTGSDYIVCYLDILGIKKEFKEKPAKAYEQVEFFRNEFFRWFGDPKGIIEMEFFSDSFLIYGEYNNSIACDLINRILASIVCTFTASLKEGFTFRGAMDIGKGKILTGENWRGFAGPVIGEVYSLESKVAVYPRIILGKQLINVIESSDGQVKPMSRWITKDMDGIDQIDIFCQEQSNLLLSENWGKNKIKTFFKEIGEKITETFREYDKKNDLTIASKWGYLLQYLRQSYIGEEYLKEFWDISK